MPAGEIQRYVDSKRSHFVTFLLIVVLTKKIIPDDILGECGVGSEEDAHDKTVQRVTLIAAVCSSVMAATVLIVTLGSVCRGGKNKDEEYDFPRASYQPVNTNDTE